MSATETDTSTEVLTIDEAATILHPGLEQQGGVGVAKVVQRDGRH